MELSKRLEWIIKKVDRSEIIVDIGTDHGYIPIYLIKNNIAKKVIATDVNRDPLKKAKINASLEDVISNIDLRLGSGLSVLKNKEANCVIIAGMGGNLIRDILEKDIKKVMNFDYLILQPAQNPEVLREYLYNSNYEILEEDICLDEGKYYEIFKVKYKISNKKNENILDYEISPLMLNKKIPLFEEYIKNKIEKNDKIIELIKDNTEHAALRKNQLIDRNNKLKELLIRF